jgi:hypothetical protein
MPANAACLDACSALNFMTDFEPKLALFLGAGFSEAWGLPLANKIIDAASVDGFPGKWQAKLVDRVKQAWQKARSEGCSSVDQFGRLTQQSNNSCCLSYQDFTKFLALRLSSAHWKVGGARETKWGTGDHIRKQQTIADPYREFLSGITKPKLIGILTTNYDIVIEKILGPGPRGRMGGSTMGTPMSPSSGAIPLALGGAMGQQRYQAESHC